jgi:hypothetical protein
MTAEIIRFILRPKHDREQTDFPTIVFRSPVPADTATNPTGTKPREGSKPGRPE